MFIIRAWWCLLMWEIGRRPGHYGSHLRPRVADRGTPSRMLKWVAPEKEGAVDKQCLGEGKLWFQTGASRQSISLFRQVWTLIPNPGRWSPFSLFRQIHLGESTLITNREEGNGKPPQLFSLDMIGHARSAQSTHQAMVMSCVSDGNVSDTNTLSIGSMATVTPQSCLLGRASSQWIMPVIGVRDLVFSRIPEEEEFDVVVFKIS